MRFPRLALGLALLCAAAGLAQAATVVVQVEDMKVVHGGADPYPEIRQIAGAAGGKALVWGATAAECAGDSASVTISATQAPEGQYTLWLRQSYSDQEAISGFTGVVLEVNGQKHASLPGPRGELYYTTSLEKFYWAPISIGAFHGGKIIMTRDASGGGLVATDEMRLTDDATWAPEGYERPGQFPKTIAAFAGPPIALPAGKAAPRDTLLMEAEAMRIDRAGQPGPYPAVEGDADRWAKASGGRVVAWNCVVSKVEAAKSLVWAVPKLTAGPWRLWVRLAHGLPPKDVEHGLPRATADTGLVITAGGKTYGPVKHPPQVTGWNELFWVSYDLKGFTGGDIVLRRKSGGGWLWTDCLILTRKAGFSP